MKPWEQPQVSIGGETGLGELVAAEPGQRWRETFYKGV